METQKAHQIFYKARDYQIEIRRYRRQDKTQYTQQELLVLAKAYFIDQDYEHCIEVLKKINPAHSTKVLFERQSLLFRAVYLSTRSQKPQAKEFANLHQIIAQFQRLKLKVPGESFRKNHLEIMQKYRDFVVFLQQYSQSSITYSQTLFFEQQKGDKHVHKLTGFPCYLLSQQWLEDFSRMKRQLEKSSGKTYLGPITNFSLINDIFQTHLHESKLETYKNTYIFPINKFKTISKKLWSFYSGYFSPDNQFCPIKRLYQQRSYKQYYAASSPIVPLVPVVIQCQKKRTIFQVNSNELVSNELLPFLESQYGTGELKNPYNQQSSFDFFYFGEKSQKMLGDLGKILVYQKKKLPDHLKNIRIFHFLQYSPIPPTCLLSKEGGLKGLQNLGNSCYLNSVVQCLSFTRQISQYLTTKDISQIIFTKNKESDGSVTLAFSDLLKQLWRATQNKSVSPHKFKKYFGIKNTMFSQRTQEDAHEFLLHLLNSVHQDLKKGSIKIDRSLSKLQVTTNIEDVKRYFHKHELQENKSIITKLMRGIFHTTILCNNCKTTSHSFDLFLALSIPVPYTNYPSLRFYFVPWKARSTQKYELTLKNVKTINQLFDILLKEVIQVKHGSKNDIKLSEESSPDKVKSVKYNYILLAFSQNQDPEQIWNYCSNNDVTKKELELGKMLQSKKQLIFYQVQILAAPSELILVQYKYKQMFYKQKAIGIPKFVPLPKAQEILNSTEADKFKKYIIDNNFQDTIYQADIEKIISNKWSSPFSYRFGLNVYFKNHQKLFLQTNLIDKELNSAIDAYDIHDCLKEMSKPDLLEGWKCGHCNQSKIAQKVQHITQTNQILIISLKRFQANGTKIRNLINYPLQKFDMKEWLEDKNSLGNHLYDLYGVCFHSGTMEYGHYRAYCKHFITGEWHEFDDERVRKVQQSDVVTSQAYMLFYKRRDI